MKKMLIENNKKHFLKAEGVSPTISLLANIMGSGISECCNKVLDGTYEIMTTLPHLVQKYLKNMKRDNIISQEQNPTIPLRKKCLKKWKEQILTSPPSLHLCHYKALLALDDKIRNRFKKKPSESI